MNIVALCDTHTAIGLRLAGISDVRIPEPFKQDETIKLWNEIEDEIVDIGLIIITEQVAIYLGKQLEQFRIRNLLPVIIEIPDKSGRKPDHVDYVTQLIKKAVGMELKK
jgi:V/A-type H+/Na+-transporting ATPase subunit F